MENLNQNEKKVQVVFSRPLAEKLCKEGFFKDLKAIDKNTRPEFEGKNIYMFYNSEGLQNAIKAYRESKVG